MKTLITLILLTSRFIFAVPPESTKQITDLEKKLPKGTYESIYSLSPEELDRITGNLSHSTKNLYDRSTYLELEFNKFDPKKSLI